MAQGFQKTKYEGVFFRYSTKINPKTGKKDKIYCFSYYENGKHHWHTVGRQSQGVTQQSVKIARAEFLAKISNISIAKEEKHNLTVGEAVDAYYAWCVSENKYIQQHYSQYRYHLKDSIHNILIIDLNPDILSKIKVELTQRRPKNSGAKSQRKTLAGQSINNIFNFVRAAINRAIATGIYSGNNPLSTKTSTWKPIQANNKRLRALTIEEAKTLLQYFLDNNQKQMHDICLLSLRTGLRPTEIFKLCGQDISADSGVIYIIDKGGKRTPVKIPEDIIQMLLSYNRQPTEPIFQETVTKRALKKTPRCFQTAVRKLNLAPINGDSLYAVTLHTMRHTFASWLAQSGQVSLLELQKLLRHQSINMTMRYAHLIPGQEVEKLSIISERLK